MMERRERQEACLLLGEGGALLISRTNPMGRRGGEGLGSSRGRGPPNPRVEPASAKKAFAPDG